MQCHAMLHLQMLVFMLTCMLSPSFCKTAIDSIRTHVDTVYGWFYTNIVAMLRYDVRLALLLQRFSPSQVLIVFTEHLAEHGGEVLRQVYRFLGLDPNMVRSDQHQ